MKINQNRLLIFISSRSAQATFFIILLLGLFLRSYQYLMGRSLWEDETHLALNFMKYGFVRLLQPLDYIQAAPVFFILCVKAVVQLFGSGEIAFRFIPFISSVLSFPLFYFIVRDLTKNRIIANIAFFIFSVNLALIYFSSELKAYAMDVAVYLLLIYLAIGSNHFVQKKRMLFLSVAGAVSLFSSSIAFIVLACIGLNWLMEWYQQKKINKTHIKVMLVWLGVFLFNYFTFIHNHPATADQRHNYSFAFCPTNVLSCEFITFLNKTIEETFFTLLLYISKSYGFAYILLLIFIVALRHLIVNKKYTILIMVCGPVLFHLVLSALRLYPFWYRLILYLVPCFIFLMAMGTYLIAHFIKKHLTIYPAIITVIIICWFFVQESLLQFPLWYREIKPAINFVNNDLPAGAHVYILDPVNAYDYYQQRGYAKKPIYRALNWELDPADFYETVYNENSNYILFYNAEHQWGYGDVLESLEKENLIVKKFEYKGYGVMEIKPLRRDSLAEKILIDHSYFDSALTFGEHHEIAIWSGSVESKPIPLKKGRYSFSVVSRGTAAEGIYPQHNFYLNKTKLGSFVSSAQYSPAVFEQEIKADTSITLKIEMTNDLTKNDQDRNSFIKQILISKLPEVQLKK